MIFGLEEMVAGGHDSIREPRGRAAHSSVVGGGSSCADISGSNTDNVQSDHCSRTQNAARRAGRRHAEASASNLARKLKGRTQRLERQLEGLSRQNDILTCRLETRATGTALTDIQTEFDDRLACIKPVL